MPCKVVSAVVGEALRCNQSLAGAGAKTLNVKFEILWLESVDTSQRG
mgnify:FL=1